MKVSREEPKRVFRPITITLETREEAVAMWHRLNANWPSIKGGSSSNPPDNSPVSGLWKQFNAVFNVNRD